MSWVSSKSRTEAVEDAGKTIPSRENPLACADEEQESSAEKISYCHPSRLDRHLTKMEVLHRYTTTEPISTFIDEEGMATVSADQRAKMLAQRIDSSGGGSDSKANVPSGNQMELIAHVEALNEELKRCWGQSEKVKSLRVTIQAIKMIASPKVPQCYPSVFVLVSSVMDTFGDFVARRLQEMAATNVIVASLLKRGREADADLIPQECVETCHNWFLKISSIRELLPRICIEMTLIKCSRYVAKKMRVNMSVVVERIAGQIRGIADPLVAAHIRWYLFLRAAEVLPPTQLGTVLTPTLFDQLEVIERQQNSITDFALLQPALQWMIDAVLASATAAARREVIDRLVKVILPIGKAELTVCIIKAVNGEELLRIGTDLLLAHTAQYSGGEMRSLLLRHIVLCLADTTDLEQYGLTKGKRTALLSEIHGIADMDNIAIEPFLKLCEALLIYSSVHLGAKQLHVLLSLVKQRVSRGEAPGGITLSEDALCNMLMVLVKFPATPLLTSPDLLPLVRLVPLASRRTLVEKLLVAMPRSERYSETGLELCRLLEQCMMKDTEGSYTDTVSSALITVAPNESDVRLNYLCDARHTLSDEDAIRLTLINIALNAVHTIGNTQQRKKRAIAKTFFAFCHVTVPALLNPFKRLQASLNCATVAFQRGFVAQGEGLLHLAVSILPQLQPFTTLMDDTVVPNDQIARDIVMQLINLGGAVPAHAKHGHFYILYAVLRWNDSYNWPLTSPGRISVFCAIIRCAARASKSEFALSFPLCGTAHYASDPAFTEAANEVATRALRCALFHLSVMTREPSTYPHTGSSAINLYETVLLYGNPGKSPFLCAAVAYAKKVAKQAAGSDAEQRAYLDRSEAHLLSVLGQHDLMLASAESHAALLRFKGGRCLFGDEEETADTVEGILVNDDIDVLPNAATEGAKGETKCPTSVAPDDVDVDAIVDELDAAARQSNIPQAPAAKGTENAPAEVEESSDAAIAAVVGSDI